MLKSREILWNQNNAKVFQHPIEIPNFYPDYQHLSTSYPIQQFLNLTLMYKTNYELRYHFGVMNSRVEFKSTSTSAAQLFKFKSFYEVKDISNSHFQLHYTLKAFSNRHLFYTSQKAVKVLNTTTGKTSSVLNAWKSKSLDYSEKHNLLIGTNSSNAFIYNTQTQKSIEGVKFYPDDDTIGRLNFINQNNNDYIGVVGNSTHVYLWDPVSQTIAKTMKSKENVNDIDYNERSRIFALAEDRTEIELLDERAHNQHLGMLSGHEDLNFACKFINEQTLATAGQDMSVRIWDLRKYDKEVMLFMSSKNAIYALEYSEKHNILFALESCSVVKCFDFKHAEVKTDKIEFMGFTTGMSLSSSQDKLFIGNQSIGPGVFEMDILP
jgi:WD40 repeat protein